MIPYITSNTQLTDGTCIYQWTGLLPTDWNNGLAPNNTWTNANINQTLMIKLQGTENQNTNIFLQDNSFKYVICIMAAILFKPQGVTHIFHWEK